MAKAIAKTNADAPQDQRFCREHNNGNGAYLWAETNFYKFLKTPICKACRALIDRRSRAARRTTTEGINDARKNGKHVTRDMLERESAPREVISPVLYVPALRRFLHRECGKIFEYRGTVLGQVEFLCPEHQVIISESAEELSRMCGLPL